MDFKLQFLHKIGLNLINFYQIQYCLHSTKGEKIIYKYNIIQDRAITRSIIVK